MGSPVSDYRASVLHPTIPLGCLCLFQEGCAPLIPKCEPAIVDSSENPISKQHELSTNTFI